MKPLSSLETTDWDLGPTAAAPAFSKDDPKAASTTRKDGGTGTWNQQPIVQLSATGDPQYLFKLHVRLPIQAADLAACEGHLVAKDMTDLVKALPTGVPLPLGVTSAAQNYLTNAASPWVIRVYHDYNSNGIDTGDFVEFEFVQPLDSADDLAKVSAYLQNPSAGETPDTDENAGWNVLNTKLTDPDARTAVGL